MSGGLSALLNERRWREYFPQDDDVEVLARAFERFCADCWFIRHPERGRIPFVLETAQSEAVREILANRYTVILKARQIGFSTLLSALAFWETFGYADRFEIMLSRTERESVKLLAKAKYGYRFLPHWLKERGPKLLTQHTQRMAFDNESGIESLPSSNDPARGESVYRIIVDEWGFLPNPEEAWASIEPVADVGGRVVGLSTANGAGTFFHELYVGAKQGFNRFRACFWPWYAAHGRDQNWYDAKKANMPDWQLHQEYPRDDVEAFIRSGRAVFDIDRLLDLAPREPARGFVEKLGARSWAMVEQDEGSLRVWTPPQRGDFYVIGADVAEGLVHGDYSAAHVLNARTGELVAMWHGHIDPDDFGTLLCDIGWFYNDALLGIEVNNHGLTTNKAAQRAKYKRLYTTRRLSSKLEQRIEQYGWRTTAPSKAILADDLRAWLRDHDVHDGGTLEELKQFVRDDNGRMHGSPHDDRVISLGIAVQMLKFVWTPEWAPNPEKAPPGSILWFKERWDRDHRPKRTRLGQHQTRA